MKYSRLTKEQFEALETEFINFLATQSITGPEWQELKKNKPEVAEQELDIFSDLIWEGVLSKATYLENAAPQKLFLFKLEKHEMRLIVVSVSENLIDLTTKDGLQWVTENVMSDSVELFTASKSYSEDRNRDVFDLIRQGATITKGEMFEVFAGFVTN